MVDVGFWREQLLTYTLRDGVGFAQLWPLALLLAVVLGYCAYTDAFCGRIIRNSANVTVGLLALATVPLLFADPGSHLLLAGAVILGIFALYAMGVFVEGDLKLYSALALLFAQGAVALIVLSWLVIMTYGLPRAVANRARRRRDVRAGTDLGRKAYLTHIPAGPGIAAAYPLTLLMAGVDAGHVVLLAAAQVMTVAVALVGADLVRRADAHEAALAAAQAAPQPAAPAAAAVSPAGPVFAQSLWPDAQDERLAASRL